MRGQRVMLDHLNQQFTRNRRRFPEDFAFQLTLAEARQLSTHQTSAARVH
jgi:hypothetical protein